MSFISWNADMTKEQEKIATIEQDCAVVGNAQGEASVLTNKTDEQVQENGVIKNAQEENTITIEKTEAKLQEIAVNQNYQGENILAEKTERPQECSIAENAHENNAVTLKTGQQPDNCGAKTRKPVTSAGVSKKVQSSSANSSSAASSSSQDRACRVAEKRPHTSESNDAQSQIDVQKALKIKRYKLQIEHFKLVNYRTKLQIHKLERELGIHNSPYTSNLSSNEQ